MKILQFVLTSQAKYIQPELRKQRDKIEANVVEKCMIYGRRMPELALHLAISGVFQVGRRLLLCLHSGHSFDFDKVQLVQQERNWVKQKILEALYI